MLKTTSSRNPSYYLDLEEDVFFLLEMGDGCIGIRLSLSLTDSSLILLEDAPVVLPSVRRLK